MTKTVEKIPQTSEDLHTIAVAFVCLLEMLARRLSDNYHTDDFIRIFDEYFSNGQ